MTTYKLPSSNPICKQHTKQQLFNFYDHQHTCSSVAFSSMKSSKVELTTNSGRAEGLSILFTTTTTEWPNSKAFFKTNLVCGIGPSTESTYKYQEQHDKPYKLREATLQKRKWSIYYMREYVTNFLIEESKLQLL